MEIFSALIALGVGNSMVTGEFLAQRPMMRSFDVFFDLLLYTRLSKQSWDWWSDTPSCSLWRHCHYIDSACWRLGSINRTHGNVIPHKSFFLYYYFVTSSRGSSFVLIPQSCQAITSTNNEPDHRHIYASPDLNELTHWGLVTPFGDIDLGQHWLR